jgi:NADPH-dependent 2,4-dienoyl-CoA reductase/sulfur reductase-like enzyme/nitrite reductase/ring-hydroxylating ferredoxin subunit
MAGGAKDLSGPDLKAGVLWDSLHDGEPLLGHADGEAIVVVKRGDALFAVGASCTHYGGPLAEGLVVGNTIRCPWHHACYSLRSGEPIGAPALMPIACFEVMREERLVKVGRKRDEHRHPPPETAPASVVIVGAGAAGTACANTLRREGYRGVMTLVGAEEPGPVDRPNLSKDFLAGTAPEEWIPLRTREQLAEQEIELVANDPAQSLDTSTKTVRLRSGRVLIFDALLIATGAEPSLPPIAGANLPHVMRLRTLADSRAIIAGAARAKRATIIGASFIGLEVAASLRHRGLEVDVVAPEAAPLARVLGPELGAFVRGLHEAHGVRFHLGTTPGAIDARCVSLASGDTLPAELVVVGVGVRPRVELAVSAGLRVDGGVIVDQNFRTSLPSVYAAGDVARYPEPFSGELARVEHWVAAERQGQAVARAMLGSVAPFRDVPFFWSQHYDVTIAYVGHAASWDSAELFGDLGQRDACVVYRRAGRALAVATIGRDKLSLSVEAAMERRDDDAVEALVRSLGKGALPK